jgi:hypothetical protein
LTGALGGGMHLRIIALHITPDGASSQLRRIAANARV